MVGEGGAERARAAAQVFVADLADPVLDQADRHHLSRVLRLRAGEVVIVCDGAGAWQRAVWRGDGAVEADGPVQHEEGPAPAITVAFALTKGTKPELVVQKLTETGVDHIVPFRGARSVVQWDAARAARSVERLRAVAREAAAQSRRVHLPAVAPLAGFAEVAAIPGATMADLGGHRLAAGTSALLVGPEGGWSDEERSAGLPSVRLGPGVLRAETAAMAAGVVLCALRAGVIGAALGGE